MEVFGTEKDSDKSSINAWFALPSRAGTGIDAVYSPSAIRFSSRLLECGFTVTRIFKAVCLTGKYPK